eukprot:TRINITY_DN6406_c1_g1_i1.p1 TRINITY_DN6406_c1_g1~~TRINITY_DN6406_c1_g1_i1.p1  ORF type:complete len:475 (+),score=142.85 TRINITY_DN6406_c1_g1_i1:136-1560(+)
MMQPGMAMMQPQGGAMMQQGAVMMPQGGMQAGMGGMQYMQCVLPVEQAMQMAQNGSVIPVAKVPMAQAQGMMNQQGCNGSGGFGNGMGNWGSSKGYQGGYKGDGKGKPDDDRLDDWLAKRFNKSTKVDDKPGGSSSSAAGRSNGMSQQDTSKQSALGQGQGQQAQQMQQQMMSQQQQQMMQMQQMQQQQYQQQLMWQQQQSLQWQQQQLQQYQAQAAQLQGFGKGSMGKGAGKGKDKDKGGKGKSSYGGDSPRTAEWRQKMAEAAPNADMDVDDWITKRSEALESGPTERIKSRPVVQRPKEEEPEVPMQPAIPMEAIAHVFADARPWAEITDEGAGDELMSFMTIQGRHEESTSSTRNEAPAAKTEAPTLVADARPAAEPSSLAPAAQPSTPEKALSPAEAPQAAPEPTPAAAPAQKQAAPMSATDKKKKALQKKLRQIEEVEEKQRNGEKLNADQLAKLATRAAIEAEIAQL